MVTIRLKYFKPTARAALSYYNTFEYGLFRKHSAELFILLSILNKLILKKNLMLFEWDDNKRFSNQKKHGIDFTDVTQLFEKPYLTKEDKRKDYGEKRWIALGNVNGNIVVVVFTFRKQTIRIISARKANKIERKIYDKKFR